MITSSVKRLSLIAAAFSFLLLLAFCSVGFSPQQIEWPMDHRRSSIASAGFRHGVVSNRKLLQEGEEEEEEEEEKAAAETNRIGEACSKDDIVVYQGATAPLPNGIPTYTVQVLNECVTGCSIARIHLSCGWFSSARLVNPRLFRRLRYDDCLVNDGRPLPNGASLSFQYANSFRYPLSVSSASCLPN